jgi:hypothetical protein
MAKGEHREAKKPKKAKIREIAAAPGQKSCCMAASPASDKRKQSPSGSTVTHRDR